MLGRVDDVERQRVAIGVSRAKGHCQCLVLIGGELLVRGNR
jgi:hypothetical protein